LQAERSATVCSSIVGRKPNGVSHVGIDGTWDGRVLALSESYAYAEGPRERKCWHLQQTAPGVFIGTYDDTIGPASIWSDGPVVRLRYKLKLAGIALDFDETMSLRDDGSVIDAARVTKWGVAVGRLEVVMRRADPSPPHSDGEVPSSYEGGGVKSPNTWLMTPPSR
jgi:hypothetical protein